MTAVFAFYRPGPALAQTVAVSGTCGVVESTDCKTSDTTFIPTAVRLSVSSGVTTVECLGTTPTVPAATTTCGGEKANFGSTGAEGPSPVHPCNIMLGSTPVSTDDWFETITPISSTLASVKLTCSAGGTDLK